MYLPLLTVPLHLPGIKDCYDAIYILRPVGGQNAGDEGVLRMELNRVGHDQQGDKSPMGEPAGAKMQLKFLKFWKNATLGLKKNINIMGGSNERCAGQDPTYDTCHAYPR